MSVSIQRPSTPDVLCADCRRGKAVLAVQYDESAVEAFCGPCFWAWAATHPQIFPANMPPGSRCGASCRDEKVLAMCTHHATLAVTSRGTGWTIYLCSRCVEDFATHY